MDVAESLVKMPKRQALQKLEAYRTALQGRLARDVREEYEQAVTGFEAMADGTPLIDLPSAIGMGGLDDAGLPMLAVARADRKEVEVEIWAHGRVVYNATAEMASHAGPTLRMQFDVPRFKVPRWRRGYALVPMVPPECRPATGQLRDHFILWEVEGGWADSRHLAEPDRDPLLLKPIVGDLYAVVAQWDLTDLERTIMSGRRPR